MSLLLTGCADRLKDVRITSFDITSLSPRSIRDISVLAEVGIENPAMGFELSGVEATVKFKAQPALHLKLDQLIVEGRCNKVYEVPLKGSVADGFNPLNMLKILNLEDNSSELSVSVKGKLALRGGFGKDFDIQDIPLGTLLNIEGK